MLASTELSVLIGKARGSKLTLKVEDHELNEVLAIPVVDSAVISLDMTARKLHTEGDLDVTNVLLLVSNGALSYFRPRG